MMRILFFFFSLLLSSVTLSSYAQGYIKSEYIPSSSFKDIDGNKLGSGDLLKYSGMYTLPLSVKQNKAGKPVVWAATLSGSYARLNNKNMTEYINPDEVLNAGLNLSHRRSISKRWSMIATLGGGVYAAPNEITTKSILVNGGVIFVYQVKDNLDLGVGAGLTNSFGVPIVMPMLMVNWRLSGKYEVNVDVANCFQVSAATKFGNRFKLKLVAIEMDGISSVMDVNGKSMIYASASIGSYLAPEYRIGKSSTLYMGIGGNWERSVTLTRRTLKDFFKNAFNNKRELHFGPTGYVSMGFRYGF